MENLEFQDTGMGARAEAARASQYLALLYISRNNAG